MLFLAALAFPLAALSEETRTFTDTRGRSMDAAVLGFSGEKVELRRSDGEVFEVKKSIFSQADRDWLADLRAELIDGPIEELNEAAGHELFNRTPFHERPAGEVAAALSLDSESRVDGLRSWRLYAAFARAPDGRPGDYRLFGAMPYSVALYATAGDKSDQLSVVYANKGDFGSTAGFGQDHFGGSAEEAGADSLEAAMRRDFDAISEALTGALGKPDEQRFGEGKSRRTVQRWDWNDVAFLLALEEEEFVTLSVVSAAFADSEGRTERVDDALIKERLADAVKRSPNGDVLIQGIPMVDQGPKGYCVPATFERAMRFMGMQADMYLLAMVGQSSAGGGTSPALLIDEVKSQVYRKGRRTRDDDMDDLAIRRLSRYIDEGAPIMWTMYSLPEYNDTANNLTREREEVEDWQAWTAKITKLNESFEDREPLPANHHICMIIGYNAETRELAVSDSWGENYELRWIPVELANWVHGGQLFMILP